MEAAVLKAVLLEWVAHLVGLVADEGNDHAVEVEEEHQQVETQLDERFLAIVSTPQLAWMRAVPKAHLLMNVQLPEDLCCVEQVVLLEYPAAVSPSPFTSRWSHILLSIPSQEGQVKYKRDPVPIDKE
jgi:hypothetical protein